MRRASPCGQCWQWAVGVPAPAAPALAARVAQVELRIVLFHHRAVEVPGQALAQVRRRVLGVDGRDVLHHRLEGSGGHVEQQLAQVRATLDAAQVLLDGAPPAARQAAAHHALHRRHRLGAGPVGKVVHGDFDGVHHGVAVHRQADRHAVDRLAGGPAAFAGDLERRRGLGVAQLGLDVPQAVVATVAAKDDVAVMQVRAGNGRGKRHGKVLSRENHEKTGLLRVLGALAAVRRNPAALSCPFPRWGGRDGGRRR